MNASETEDALIKILYEGTQHPQIVEWVCGHSDFRVSEGNRFYRLIANRLIVIPLRKRPDAARPTLLIKCLGLDANKWNGEKLYT